jgi:hypothetical protein
MGGINPSKSAKVFASYRRGVTSIHELPRRGLLGNPAALKAKKRAEPSEDSDLL